MPDELPDKKTTAKKSKRRRRRRAIILLLVFVIVAVVAHILSSPAEGHQEAVSQQAVVVKNAQRSLPPASTTSNQYYSLHLPVGFTPQAPNTTTSGQLLSQTIIKPGDQGSLIIAIGISTLPAGGLSNNSSYHLRTTAPQTYGLSNQTINGSNVSIATRLDGSEGEVTAFWVHGGYLATIAVTDGVGNASSGDTAPDRAVLMTVLDAWQWR